MSERTKKKRKSMQQTLVVEPEQANRLQALAARWKVSTNEALRRALDQAFIGRGALVALEAGFVFLEHLVSKKDEKKLPEGDEKKLPDGAVEAVPYAEQAIARSLRQAREAAGLTQVQLAEKLGKSQSMVGNVEAGRVRVGMRYVREVLSACGLPLNWTAPERTVS